MTLKDKISLPLEGSELRSAKLKKRDGNPPTFELTAYCTYRDDTFTKRGSGSTPAEAAVHCGHMIEARKLAIDARLDQ